MVRQVVALLCGLLACTPVIAAVTQFPYEAVVERTMPQSAAGRARTIT